MTTEQIHELERWIAVNVMGWLILPSGCFSEPHGGREGIHDFQPCSMGEDAIEVLKKCAQKQDGPISISKLYQDWLVGHSKAETLELAICLFAKELFSK